VYKDPGDGVFRRFDDVNVEVFFNDGFKGLEAFFFGTDFVGGMSTVVVFGTDTEEDGRVASSGRDDDCIECDLAATVVVSTVLLSLLLPLLLLLLLPLLQLTGCRSFDAAIESSIDDAVNRLTPFVVVIITSTLLPVVDIPTLFW
jgi:hypothetical protein